MPRSALVVEVPEAEPAVHDWRMKFDNARLGVPSHITLLFPFIPTGQLDDGIKSTLRGLFALQPAISFALTKLTVFPDETIWLAPEPAEPFRRLTELIFESYPGYPPYEGIHDEVIPHLTVSSGDASRFPEIESDLAPQLPIDAETKAVTLLVEDDAGMWTVSDRFALAR